jgi:dTDP-4-dehydrorhamnose reductase
MKIAVLGASGFLGNYITQYFQSKEYLVLPVTRQIVDLTDYQGVTRWLQENRPTVVINCATAGGKQRMGDALLDDVQNNINLFLNFYNNDCYFDKFINIGSGAEFDKSKNVDRAREVDIFSSFPKDSYGYSKNVISRLCYSSKKFYTLRLFGCFDKSEPDFRLFKKFINDEPLDLVDRQFDYFSTQDFCTVLEHYVNNRVFFKDVNCVYSEKLFLSQILSNFKPVTIEKTSDCNYTGDSDRLELLDLPLLGLERSIKEYKSE